MDDILIAGNDETEIKKTKEILNQKFSIKDLGNAKYFLGIEIARNSKGIYLNQRKYVLDIINNLGLMGCKASNTPMQKGFKSEPKEEDELTDPEPFRRLIEKLIYLNLTRPYITLCVQQLS